MLKIIPTARASKWAKRFLTASVLLLGGLELVNFGLQAYLRYHLPAPNQTVYAATGIRIYGDSDVSEELSAKLSLIHETLLRAHISQSDVREIYFRGKPRWWVPSQQLDRWLRHEQLGRYANGTVILGDSFNMEDLFHELMHARLAKYEHYQVLEQQWTDLNHEPYLSTDGYRYALSIAEDPRIEDVKALQLGYMNQYARTSFEEDFCELMSTAVYSPQSLQNHLANDIILRKLQLAQESRFLPEDWFRYVQATQKLETKEQILLATDSYLTKPGIYEAEVRYWRAAALLTANRLGEAEQEYHSVLRLTQYPTLYRLTLRQLRSLHTQSGNPSTAEHFHQLEDDFNAELLTNPACHPKNIIQIETRK